MVTTLVEADSAVLDDRVAVAAQVQVEGGVVTALSPTAPTAARRVRVAGCLLPGLIDLQVNGAGGHAVEEAVPHALDAIAAQVARGGASAFLPTLVTAPFATLLEQIAAVAAWIAARPADATGAQPLGIHLEGPFLERAGAHDPAHFIDPTPERVLALLAAARGHLALLTLAPGRRGAPAAVAQLRAAGVAVSLGHAESAHQFAECVAAGAGMVTHLFNAMGALHHRSPGLAGLALDEPAVRCALIPDGVHVHPAMLRSAWRCLGPDRTLLVTDSIAAAGMPDGAYQLGGRAVLVSQGVARGAGGELAGSALTMAEAVRRWRTMVPSAGAWTVAQIAARGPAEVLGRADWGRIAVGARAHFSVVGPDGTLSALEIQGLGGP